MTCWCRDDWRCMLYLQPKLYYQQKKPIKDGMLDILHGAFEFAAAALCVVTLPMNPAVYIVITCLLEKIGMQPFSITPQSLQHTTCKYQGRSLLNIFKKSVEK